MRWKPRPPRPEWERWFAWHPVETLDGTLAWLEVVERHWESCMAGGYWQHRLVDGQPRKEEGP